MKETSSIKTTASAPLKQDVQPSVTMLKKRKKKEKKKKKKEKKEEKRNQFLTSAREFLTVWNFLKVIEK